MKGRVLIIDSDRESSEALSACVKASEEIPARVETPSTPSPLKLACEPPERPDVPESDAGKAESDRAPHFRIVADRPEKVPISVA